jgi:hypothetical protein
MLGLLLWGSPIFLFSFCQQVSPCYDRGSTAQPGGGQIKKISKQQYFDLTPSELCSQFWYGESRNRATGKPTCTARSLVS